MITTRVGTCNGCGMGVTIPRGRGITPGEIVHILTDREWHQLRAGEQVEPDPQPTARTTPNGTGDTLYRKHGIVP